MPSQESEALEALVDRKLADLEARLEARIEARLAAKYGLSTRGNRDRPGKPAGRKGALPTEFRELADRWRAETGMLSSASQRAMHPAYQAIIGMGKDAVPLILTELRKEPDHWFWALRAITRQNPIRAEDRGYVDRMANRWLEWGRAEGYTA